MTRRCRTIHRRTDGYTGARTIHRRTDYSTPVPKSLLDTPLRRPDTPANGRSALQPVMEFLEYIPLLLYHRDFAPTATATPLKMIARHPKIIQPIDYRYTLLLRHRHRVDLP